MPLRRWLSACALGLLAWAAAAPAWAGTVVAAQLHSTLLGRDWAYNVYLPTGYDEGRLRYPVLYLLHGNGANRDEWVQQGHIRETADALIAAGTIPPAIIVMPSAGNSWYVDLREMMESAFFDELIPHVEANYRALATRDARVIAGVSMGGYGALRYALEYPERFQAVALLSAGIYNPEPPPNSAARQVGVFTRAGAAGRFDPAVWQAWNYPALWDGFLARRIPLPIYLMAGDDDEFGTWEAAARLYGQLRRNGQPSELRIVDGHHDWTVWSAGIGEALRYIFRGVQRPAPP